jgi:hypothetical protein
MEISIMAYFAELDDNNVVLRVISISNDELLDENNIEQEYKGILFCQNLFGGQWIQTSYNNNIRKNYAGIGYTYDTQLNAFISPQPEGNGWVLDEATCIWRNPELEAAQASISTGVTRV